MRAEPKDDERAGMDRPAQKIASGTRWGIWVYSNDPPSLTVDLDVGSPRGNTDCDIWDFALDGLCNGRELLRMVTDLRAKTWMGRADLGDLLIALNDLGHFGPYW